MRIAIPVANGRLSPHFGHCLEFALFDVDEATKTIRAHQTVPAPDHAPGLLPRWLREQGADVVIAGGMGMRAQNIFQDQGITVVVGAPPEAPQQVVEAFLADHLQTGPNICDH
jgi:predicted Fe-Mo cluster-binding NifX family protein